jgi:hypothetical protein
MKSAKPKKNTTRALPVKSIDDNNGTSVMATITAITNPTRDRKRRELYRKMPKF